MNIEGECLRHTVYKNKLLPNDGEVLGISLIQKF